ncbi:hypothetical protein QMK52_18690 [Pseudomonas sp. P9_2]|uniref:hypothetical protein n=1 Tax=Pseudomonas sp. P9_2 TaxID=3043447 RepID=UPI002A366DA5|nr:hypothetical protein [Pseudomonas sp. P9_2]WPN50921.1 hypothetical protein QMK52_18690 [Pseudomonas sp. P9_2]
MPLTKPNQQLRRDLKAIAFNLEQSCIDLVKLAEKLIDADAIALMGLVGTLYEEADRLVGYADDVKAGRIVRGKVELIVRQKSVGKHDCDSNF